MVHRFITASREAKAAGSAKTAATIRVPATGVAVRGETFSKTAGMRPSRDMDSRMRVWPYITASTTEAMATTAPKATMAPPTVEPVTSLTTWDSAAGRPPTSSAPMAPIAASATAQYSRVTTPMQTRIATGTSRRGFLASSPVVVIASKPMYEKKAAVVPAPMPPRPAGVKGLRLPSLNAL
jgi:hypothetical protein